MNLFLPSEHIYILETLIHRACDKVNKLNFTVTLSSPCHSCCEYCICYHALFMANRFSEIVRCKKVTFYDDYYLLLAVKSGYHAMETMSSFCTIDGEVGEE